MIIKHFELKKKIDKKIDFYLLYGPNTGLIEETLDKIIKPYFSKNIYLQDEKEILINENEFQEKIFNKSFFEKDKLIIINRGTDKILNLMKDVIEKKVEDLKIVIKADVLDKKSKLRTFFEKSTHTIIVPFYEDNHQTLLALAQDFMRENKIKISSQNINIIIGRAKGNRINLKNELEKIANYSLKKQSVDLNEVIKLTNLAENYSVSEMIDQCLSGNNKKTLNILNENNPSLDDNIIIVKNFLYKLKRLKILKEIAEEKNSTEKALAEYKPPIFWKDKDIVKQQLKIWSKEKIQIQIKKVNELEKNIKKNSQIANYSVNNFIFESLRIINN
tara:strand:+ start:1198 stop:2193 length:996 start_codon:yes stop_codon:yes gene_type:complete